jgi:hypothetical protein
LPPEWAKEGPVRAPGSAAFAFVKLEFLVNGEPSASSADGAKVRFRVDKGELAAEGMRPEGVHLYRWTSDGWVTVPTQILSNTGDAVAYSANAAGPGLYAVAASDVVPAHGSPAWLWPLAILGLLGFAGVGIAVFRATRPKKPTITKLAAPVPTTASSAPVPPAAVPHQAARPLRPPPSR